MPSVQAGAILFVRSGADLARAVWTVNTLLAHRRQRGDAGDTLLGIVMDTSLDANVPRPESYESPCAPGAVTLRESVGMGGVWSVCWFDWDASDTRVHTSDARRAVLDAVLLHARNHRADIVHHRALFPVLTRDESIAELAFIVDELRERYPMVEVGAVNYAHDPSRGGVVQLSTMEAPADAMWVA